ncbi:hypothetical protein PFAG_03282 [Plasmodium falciparum Santa Lucia]|uniref:Uncharacterized protein n=2 Tax=Plasmodium falciparum TaxID=5833 RepID=W7G4M3_PLAFA|nr:hypothetical protein PFNF135_03447 [Plasmodium falciparum NF135/5.C10]EUT84191.1 hypothetical protein PFAG_03282 [Plasmodium falciparum Santa Lucia]
MKNKVAKYIIIVKIYHTYSKNKMKYYFCIGIFYNKYILLKKIKKIGSCCNDLFTTLKKKKNIS